MKIKKISVENIRSYENANIEFPEGSTLLSGDIGSGKSSILLALEFALFGLEKGNLSGSGLLRKGADNGQVRLELEIDGKNIAIERSLKKGKNSISQEKTAIYINNEKHELSTEELKHKVLTLLEYPLEFLKKTNFLYRFTVYTPQEEMKQILLEKAEERINTLRKIFGIDKYKTISENIDIVTKAIKENIANKQGKIDDIDKTKQELETKKEEKEKLYSELQQAMKESEELEIRLQEKKESLKNFEQDIKKFNTLKERMTEKKVLIRNFDERIVSLKENIGEYDKKIVFLQEELKDKNLSDMQRITDQIKENQRQTEECQKENILLEKKISSIETEIKKIEKSANELNSLNICPTCKQEVKQEHKHSISTSSEKEIRQKLVELKDINENSAKIQVKLQELRFEFNRLCNFEKQFSLAEFKFKDLNDKIEEKTKISEELFVIEKRYLDEKNSLTTLAKEFSELQGIEENFDSAKKEFEIINLEERKIAIKKAKFEHEYTILARDIKEIEKELIAKEKILSRVVYLKNLNEWLSENLSPFIANIERVVMLTVYNEFNSLFEKWFSILAENLSARLDDNFTPIIEQAGYEIDYDYLSGGERTAAALAYRLSLNQVINSLMSKLKTHDLLILDEPTDGFSQQQLEKIRDILNEIKLKQLIIVSHEPQIESFVQNIIRFEKENNVTRIQQ